MSQRSNAKGTSTKTSGATREHSFTALIQSIQTTHQQLAEQASRAVNISLTLRNWLIGHHIAEYELNGQDRATYGAKLLPLLAQALGQRGVVRSEERELRRYRQFYQTYPQIRETLPPETLLRLGAGDNQLFVSKYQLELPKKEDMQQFMDAQMKDMRQSV